MKDADNAKVIASVLVLKARAGDLKAIEMLCKFELDLPDPTKDPTLPPKINITLVQPAGSTAPAKKSITINGKEYPVQLSKENRI